MTFTSKMLTQTTFILILTTTFSALIGATPVKRADTFLIRNTGNPASCLGALEAPGNGVRLNNFDCVLADDPTSGFIGKFEIVRGSNNGIRLAGTSYCMDAGLPLGVVQDFAPKLWQCYPGSPQQTWYYTDDDHIAVQGSDECVDYLAYGCGRFTCSAGTLKCSDALSQRWTLSPVGSTTPAPTTPTPTTPAPTPTPPTTQSGVQLHFNGDTSKCIFVGNLKTAVPGVASTVSACQVGGPNFSLQYFDISRGRGAVKLSGSSYNLCLDSGSNPQNGALAKFETCNGGATQDFWYTGSGDDHIAITGGTLCLDLKREDGTTLQFWQCGSNPQQKFTL